MPSASLPSHKNKTKHKLVRMEAPQGHPQLFSHLYHIYDMGPQTSHTKGNFSKIELTKLNGNLDPG